MTLNDLTPKREALSPEGRNPAVPPQSVRSCELVIEALAQELAHVHDMLGRALETHARKELTLVELRDACKYAEGWSHANKFLCKLRQDWPHLDV